MGKLKENLKKPKSELREGFETMQFYKFDGDGKTELYRFYLKGSVVVFKVAKSRKRGELIGVQGWFMEAWRMNGIICYDVFQRLDGVMFFIGESEQQIVASSQRTREAISANRFN